MNTSMTSYHQILLTISTLAVLSVSQCDPKTFINFRSQPSHVAIAIVDILYVYSIYHCTMFFFGVFFDWAF